jgi:hypothetical protein
MKGRMSGPQARDNIESMGLLILTIINLAVAGTGFAIAFADGWRRHAYSIVWWCIVASMLAPFLAQRTDGGLLLGLFVVEFFAIPLGWFFSSILWSVDEIFDEALSSRLRRTLVPEHWDGFFPRHYTPPRDHVRRMFVAVAASMGAVVFSLFGLGIFWTTLWEQLSFANVVVTSLLFIVGMFLVGPLQSYIFGLGAEKERPADPSAELSELFSSGFDRRAAGRFGLVALAGVQLGLLTNCVAATVQSGNEVVYYTVLTAALTPAVVSYYLSAALQLEPERLTSAIFRPTLFAGAVVSYGIAFISTAALSLVPDDGEAGLSFFAFLLLLIAPVTAIPVALLISAVTTLLPALVVAYAIERFRNGPVMLYVAGGLLAVGIAPTIALALYSLIAEAPFTADQFLPFLLGTAGWIVGLWSSGFPRLLREGKSASGTAAASAR